MNHIVDEINPLKLKEKVYGLNIPDKFFDGIRVYRIASNGTIQQRLLKFGHDRLSFYLQTPLSNEDESMAPWLDHQYRNRVSATDYEISNQLQFMDKKPEPVMKNKSEAKVIFIDVSFIDRLQIGPWTDKFDLALQRLKIEVVEKKALSVL